MSRRVGLALRALAVAVISVAVWFFVRNIEWAKLGAALCSATVWPLLLAAVLNFVCLWGKAAAWHIMLRPRFTVRIARLFRYTIAAFAASAIAPARAGEVLRIWVLKRRDGIPAAETAAVAVGEKLLDGITMLILVAPLPWLLPDLPHWVGGSIAVCAGIAFVLFVGLYLAVGHVDVTDHTASVIRQFIAGMHVLRSPRRLAGTFVMLVIVWAADLGMVMLVLHAVGVSLPISGGLLILFTLNLTIMVPSTPAQVGALEVGALAGLRLMGVNGEAALAFALLYHAVQVLPLLVIGMLLEIRLVLGREPLADLAVAPCDEPVPVLSAPAPRSLDAVMTRSKFDASRAYPRH